MAYAISGDDAPAVTSASGGVISKAYTVVETDAGSAAEFVVQVPPVGTMTMLKWELATAGSSSTMQPTFRTATGAWDGAGAGANDDANRVTAAAAQGNEQTAWRFIAPGRLLYVRCGYDNAAEDASGKLDFTIIKGHI